MAATEVICITGAKGMLGRELVDVLHSPSDAVPCTVHALDIEDVDITRADEVAAMARELKPDVIINAAAYTDVDGAESQQEIACAVNADGPMNLADACRHNNARLVHVSTDYVFDGSKASPYGIDDPVGPINVYGKTKLDGERKVREILPDHIIVRTSWLYGTYGRNFVKTILRLSQEKNELRVVTDQVGSPTYAHDLARVLVTLARSGKPGTYHFCNGGSCSWYDFAKAIVRLAKRETQVIPVTTAEFPRPARRPAFSMLDTSRLTEQTGIRPRPWESALAECLERQS